MRVIVTRAAAQADELVAALERAGFDPVRCPLIEIEPIEDGAIDVRGYDWVIVTSANGAEQFADRHDGPLPKVAAIGPATAAALTKRGIDVDFVPSAATQDALVAEFPPLPGRVLLVGAEDARRLVVAKLGADFRAVYRTRRLHPDPPPEGDLVVLASPSAAEAFASLRVAVPAVTIGPQTTRAARSHGVRVVLEAESSDVAGVVRAVREAAR